MSRLFHKVVFISIFIILSLVTRAQTTIDLFKEAEEERNPDITTGTFKSTRIVNGQSIENVGTGILDFKLLHRFGPLSDGSYNAYGLDQASMRIGLDYGISSRLMVGIGRSTYQKTYDGFLKFRIIRQQSGYRNIPLSISYASSMMLKTLKETPTSYNPYSTDRYSFSHQLLFASKLNDYISIQLTPTLLHYNLVDSVSIPNDFYSLGFGSRIRISKRVNLTTEYYHRYTKMSGFNDPLTLGIDIETGGHVFQLHVTNSTGMTERTFINETAGSWSKGDIRFGFNITRAFGIRKPKELRNGW